MKKALFFILLLFSFVGFKTEKPDDTATLQAIFTAGGTLASGHTYTVSSTLMAHHSVNMNNSAINFTGSTGFCIKIVAANVKISSGIVKGTWDYTTTYNPSGTGGIALQGNTDTVNNMHVSSFSGYGIDCSNIIAPVISNNYIEKTGFIAFYYDPEANTSGGKFINNIVDRSMLNPHLVTQLAVGIRGCTKSGLYNTTNWTITGNTIKMPIKPDSAAAECMEFRFMTNSKISNNICNGGTIGISAVADNTDTLSHNNISNSKSIGIEIGASTVMITGYNSINNSNGDGYLLDGYPGPIASQITLLNDTVKNSANSPVHLFTKTKNIFFIGGVYKTTSKGIDCQASDSLTFTNTTIDGLSTPGTCGIFLDNGSPGNIKYNNGQILNCTRAVQSYNTALNYVVNNIIGSNVDLTGTTTQFYGVFSNGAHFGSNIRFNTLSFGTIASRVYGVADFDPGAASGLAITYTSGNSAVATIVSSKIHIVGVGTSTITANNGDMSLAQPVMITKAPLTITADDKSKAYGAVNPALTAHYSAFQYSQDHTVLTSQPVLTTSAVTGSNPGPYLITPSGATAANYSIVFIQGTLTVNEPISPGTGKNPVIRKHRVRIKNF